MSMNEAQLTALIERADAGDSNAQEILTAYNVIRLAEMAGLIPPDGDDQ